MPSGRYLTPAQRRYIMTNQEEFPHVLARKLGVCDQAIRNVWKEGASREANSKKGRMA